MISPFKRSFWSVSMITGAALMLLLVIAAVFAPMFMSDAATKLTDNASLSPSAEHWLGTDDFGRDNLARSLVAARLTLLMTLGATAIGVVGGSALGVGIWLAPRKLRETCLRLLETAVAYPALIFALIIAAILEPGAGSAVIAIGVAGIPGFARLTANLAAGVSASEYVTTARLLGVAPGRIAVRHMLPNMAEPLLILIATVFALSLVEISALSFIGLGVQSPEFDFGRLLNDALDAMYVQPIQAVGPAIMIIATGLGAMLIGDALAAQANPRTKRLGRPRRFESNQVIVDAGTEALVNVQDLRVTLPNGVELVKGVSLSIAPGEIVALVGESGSGKSLTAMAIAGLQAEELGMSATQLRVGDMNMLAKPNQTRLAKEVAIVYQDPGTTFNPSLRMGSQLTEVQRTHMGVSPKQARETMIAALEQVNIQDPAHRMKQHPHELSGGMRQRAMIAAAMVTDAKLLIADEPTTALDVTVQAEVLRQLKTVQRANSTALLFISHDLGVVQELCDTVIVMKDGVIVERLTAGQLAARDVRHPYTQRLLDAIPTLQIDTEPVSTSMEAPA